MPVSIPTCRSDHQAPEPAVDPQFILNSSKRPKRVVHGHAPRPDVEILPHRIGVDTGAYVTGRLSAVAISGRDCRVLQALR